MLNSAGRHNGESFLLHSWMGLIAGLGLVLIGRLVDTTTFFWRTIRKCRSTERID